MNLPAWWSDKAQRRRQNARSREQERVHARNTGGKQQRGSGSSYRAPGDVRQVEYLDELKYTDKSEWSLRLRDWVAILYKARLMGREPRMIVEFNDGHKKVRLVIQEWDEADHLPE